MQRPEFTQYRDEAPRFYRFEQWDWTPHFDHAMATTLHIWQLSDQLWVLPGQLPSIFSHYGVVTDRSFYCPVFTRTPNGLLWLACPCRAGDWRRPCRHVAGAYNFHAWREEAGMIGADALEGEGRPAGTVLPQRFTC